MTDEEILIWYESLESATCNTESPERAIIVRVRELLASPPTEAAAPASLDEAVRVLQQVSDAADEDYRIDLRDITEAIKAARALVGKGLLK